MCEGAKSNSFEINVIVLSYIRNVNLPLKNDFKFAELLTKTSFFLFIRDCQKMTKKTNQADVESIYAKVTKHVSKKVAKAEANLNCL